MECVRYWSVVISAERYESERLYQHDGLAVALPDRYGMSIGDQVVLVAATRTPVAFGVGTIRSVTSAEVRIAYVRRMFDEPRPASAAATPVHETTKPAIQETGEPTVPDTAPMVREISALDWSAVASPLDRSDDARYWLVSVDLPIEAPSAAEAVRQFWSYVTELGPSELPAFVSPADDELAMQAMVAGVEVNLDPEDE
ncbi:MAG TPA: hypothetical protein VH442_12370 [Micromonosporaceae bacterium]|jgi:hypothetical protein